MTSPGIGQGPPPAAYRFGPFEYRPRAVELRREGRPVRLQELPLQILEALLERPGDLVSRDELRQRLWPEGTHVEFDNSLNAAVSKLRDALRDSAADPRYVATVPRRGYRLIADVEVEPAAGDPAPVMEEVRPARGRRAALAAALVVSVGAVVTLGVVTLRKDTPDPGSVGQPARKMLAVLPLENLGGDPSQDYFSDGLTEEIITRLSQIDPERLGVIARTSVMQYRGDRPTVRQVAEDLGVDHVVEGTVRREGNTVRITVQLIDATTRAHVWAETFDRDLEGVLSVQRDIARLVAREIAPELLSKAADPEAPRIGTQAFEAYEAYLQGLYLVATRTQGGLESALARFDQAAELDPDYAAAHQGKADAYALLGIYDYWRPEEAFVKAREQAARALELDPSDALAHASMAIVQAAFDWDLEGAEASFDRALALSPGSARIRRDHAGLLSARGRFDEAVAEIERALVLDPVSLITRAEYGWILFFARRYEQAVRALEEGLELNPDFLPLRDNLKWVHVRTGDETAAFADYLEVIRLEGDSAESIAATRQRYEAGGYERVIREGLESMERRAEQNYHSPYDMALEYATLGEVDPAVRALERSYEEREIDMIYLAVDPRLDSVRQDPRVRHLLARVGVEQVTDPGSR